MLYQMRLFLKDKQLRNRQISNENENEKIRYVNYSNSIAAEYNKSKCVRVVCSLCLIPP